MTAFYIALGCLGGVALVICFVLMNNDWLKTSVYGIDMPDFSDKLNIVHLSDLHGKSFGRGNARLIEAVRKRRPDFIAITGDIVHRYTAKDKRVAIAAVTALSQIAPVVYVAGNHEMRNKGYRFFRRDLIEAGAAVLDDCTAYMCGLTVVGLNCASLKNDTLERITPDCGNKILLAHMPQFIDKYSAAGYDLVLCGHAHGGQWRIPFTNVGFYCPGQGLLPKLTSGVHTRGKTRTVISRGLGNSQCPLRLFNRPEIVVIKINGGK